MEDKLKKFVTENREAFESKAPSAEVWNRIKSRIEPPKRERKILRNWMWSAAAVALVLFTIGSFWHRNQNMVDVPNNNMIAHSDTVEKKRMEYSAEKPVHTQMDIASIDIEPMPHRSVKEVQQEPPIVEDIREVEESEPNAAVMLAMLQDPHSAIKRMEGVLQAREFVVVPQEIMEQLHTTVNHDPNSNVRMAALELLMVHTPMSEWDEKIQDVFVQQDDPILQLELMQVMATVDSIGINPATADKLYEIAEDPLAIDLVKEQAYAVLMKNW